MYGGQLYCLRRVVPLRPIHHHRSRGRYGPCCLAASQHCQHPTENTCQWNYYAANKTCALFDHAENIQRCPHSASGWYAKPPTPPCNCTRVHKAVGRENLTVAYGGYQSMHPAGGEWYSHPSLGQCRDGQRVGDGSGCTWRVVSRERVIKASCLYARLDANVEGHDPVCFSACPQPHNVTSDCFLSCYSRATRDMTHDQLTAPWVAAFASSDAKRGGCPEVHV